MILVFLMSVVDTEVAVVMLASYVVISSNSALVIGGSAKGESPLVASCLEEVRSPSKSRVAIIVSNEGVILIFASRYFTGVVRRALLTLDFFAYFRLVFLSQMMSESW